MPDRPSARRALPRASRRSSALVLSTLICVAPLLFGANSCGSGGGGAAAVENVLIVYNTNAGAEAAGIAGYYASRRSVPVSHQCAVAAPVGQFGSADQLLGVRRTIVEDCICALIPSAERPVPCDVSNLDAVRLVSPITHLAIVRGMPPRLTGTGWPSDAEEPSFDFYLAYLLYRDETIFGSGTTGVVTSTYLTQDLLEQASDFMILSAPRLDTALHRDVAHGRIEAIDFERTLALIDRTLEAERAGVTGTFLEEKTGKGFRFLRALTGSHAAACSDYQTHQPFLFDTPESSWPWQQCRAGTTFATAKGPDPGSTADDARRSVVPGSAMSVVPRAMQVGLFLGSAPNQNLQAGFNEFETLANWRRTEGCTPLCADHPTQAERDACVADSSDYFRELDTSCVGGARGLIGHQVRSYPVQYYGFQPAGWGAPSTGGTEKTPPSVVSGGAWQDAVFGDDRYLHLGHHEVGAPDASTCTLEDGSTAPCLERIALDLQRTAVLAPPVPVAGSRAYVVRLRHRNQASPGGALRVVLGFGDATTLVEKEASLPLAAGHDAWTQAELAFVVTDAELGQIDAVTLRFATRLEDGLQGFLDLDGVELVDVETGAALLETSIGSFAVAPQASTHPGDWAANAIDRLGAIAWWGSSSHHLTGGWGLSDDKRFYGAFFMGRTLGESLLLTSGAEAGLIYGDPLYRPVAVRMHVPGVSGYAEAPGLPVGSADLATLGSVLLEVRHGSDHAETVRWSVASCTLLDPAACSDLALWTERASGVGEQSGTPLDWSAFLEPGVEQDLLLRLRVWNPGEEADELFHLAYFHFTP